MASTSVSIFEVNVHELPDSVYRHVKELSEECFPLHVMTYTPKNFGVSEDCTNEEWEVSYEKLKKKMLPIIEIYISFVVVSDLIKAGSELVNDFAVKYSGQMKWLLSTYQHVGKFIEHYL